MPFPGASAEATLAAVDAALARCAGSPTFALLDHITSQPALVLPIKEMVALCRRQNVQVAVDGAHGFGHVPLDVAEIGADFYYTNLHKWGFAPTAVTALAAADASLLAQTHHVIPSWEAGAGLAVESRWPGTRDFSAALSVPAALEYGSAWRSTADETAMDFTARRYRESARMLEESWDVPPTHEDAGMAAAMGMVRLPRALDVRETPGVPADDTSVRTRLRSEHGIEAAIGAFPDPLLDGRSTGFIRLSSAVYNTEEEYGRLRDAVLELAESRGDKSG